MLRKKNQKVKKLQFQVKELFISDIDPSDALEKIGFVGDKTMDIILLPKLNYCRICFEPTNEGKFCKKHIYLAKVKKRKYNLSIPKIREVYLTKDISYIGV